MRVLGVCRVSTAEQATEAHFSFAAQSRAIRTYSDHQGWHVVDIIQYVCSGGSNQKELDAILDRVQHDHIQVVVVSELDRLARDMVTTLLFLEDLQRVGCRFVSVNDALDLTTPDGELRMMMLSLFAHYFRRQLSRKVLGGLHERFKSGKQHGRAPYGYRSDNGRLIVYPPEADIVEQIFRWYVEEDRGFRAIAGELNARGIPSPSGRTNGWDATGVRAILRRPAYAGILAHQMRRVERDRRGRSHVTPKTPDVKMDNHPAVVSQHTWEVCQERMADKRRMGPSSQRSPYPVSGLMRCGICGSHMTMQQGQYYYCRAYKSRGLCSTATSIDRAAVEAIVRDELTRIAKGTLNRQEVILWGQDEPTCAQWLKNEREREYQVNRVHEQMDRAVAALLDGTLEKAEYRQVASRLQDECSRLETGVGEVPPACVDTARSVIQRAAEYLGNIPDDPQENLWLRQILQRVIDHITVSEDRIITVCWRSHTSYTPASTPSAPSNQYPPTDRASEFVPGFPLHPELASSS